MQAETKTAPGDTPGAPERDTARDTAFADNLVKLMAEKEISVDRMTAITGINRRLISRYRSKGKNHSVPVTPFGKPSANAGKLADALGITVDDLFPGE